MADHSPRRRFQFSLRTLLIVVTLFCIVGGGYIGWQKKIVMERRAWLARLLEQGFKQSIGDRVIAAGDQSQPNIVRRWLGDKATFIIGLPAGMSDEDKETTLRLFPESTVTQTPSAPSGPATKSYDNSGVRHHWTEAV
jgi:hypothetical protein